MSKSVQTNRMRKKSSTESIGLSRPGKGRPSAKPKSAPCSELLAIITVTKGDESPKSVEDDGSVDDAVHEQLPEILDGRDAPLIVFENVFLRDPVRALNDQVTSESLTSIPIRMPSMTWSTTAIPNSG